MTLRAQILFGKWAKHVEDVYTQPIAHPLQLGRGYSEPKESGDTGAPLWAVWSGGTSPGGGFQDKPFQTIPITSTFIEALGEQETLVYDGVRYIDQQYLPYPIRSNRSFYRITRIGKFANGVDDTNYEGDLYDPDSAFLPVFEDDEGNAIEQGYLSAVFVVGTVGWIPRRWGGLFKRDVFFGALNASTNARETPTRWGGLFGDYAVANGSTDITIASNYSYTNLDLLSFGTGDFAIRALFKVNSADLGGILMTTPLFSLWLDSGDGTLVFEADTGSGLTELIRSPGAAVGPFGDSLDIVINRSAGTTELIVNSVSVGTTTEVFDLDFSVGDEQLIVGTFYEGPGGSMDGGIEIFEAYDAALTQAQIDDLVFGAPEQWLTSFSHVPGSSNLQPDDDITFTVHLEGVQTLSGGTDQCMLLINDWVEYLGISSGKIWDTWFRSKLPAGVDSAWPPPQKVSQRFHQDRAVAGETHLHYDGPEFDFTDPQNVVITIKPPRRYVQLLWEEHNYNFALGHEEEGYPIKSWLRLTNGSAVVTADALGAIPEGTVNSEFTKILAPGDEIRFEVPGGVGGYSTANKYIATIDTVDSDTQFTMTMPWPYDTATAERLYKVERHFWPGNEFFRFRFRMPKNGGSVTDHVDETFDLYTVYDVDPPTIVATPTSETWNLEPDQAFTFVFEDGLTGVDVSSIKVEADVGGDNVYELVLENGVFAPGFTGTVTVDGVLGVKKITLDIDPVNMPWGRPTYFKIRVADRSGNEIEERFWYYTKIVGDWYEPVDGQPTYVVAPQENEGLVNTDAQIVLDYIEEPLTVTVNGVTAYDAGSIPVFQNSWTGFDLDDDAGRRLVLIPPVPFTPLTNYTVISTTASGAESATFRVETDQITSDNDAIYPRITEASGAVWLGRIVQSEGKLYLRKDGPLTSEVEVIPESSVFDVGYDSTNDKFVLLFVTNGKIFYATADPADVPVLQPQPTVANTNVNVFYGHPGMTPEKKKIDGGRVIYPAVKDSKTEPDMAVFYGHPGFTGNREIEAHGQNIPPDPYVKGLTDTTYVIDLFPTPDLSDGFLFVGYEVYKYVPTAGTYNRIDFIAMTSDQTVVTFSDYSKNRSVLYFVRPVYEYGDVRFRGQFNAAGAEPPDYADFFAIMYGSPGYTRQGEIVVYPAVKTGQQETNMAVIYGHPGFVVAKFSGLGSIGVG